MSQDRTHQDGKTFTLFGGNNHCPPPPSLPDGRHSQKAASPSQLDGPDKQRNPPQSQPDAPESQSDERHSQRNGPDSLSCAISRLLQQRKTYFAPIATRADTVRAKNPRPKRRTFRAQPRFGSCESSPRFQSAPCNAVGRFSPRKKPLPVKFGRHPACQVAPTKWHSRKLGNAERRECAAPCAVASVSATPPWKPRSNLRRCLVCTPVSRTMRRDIRGSPLLAKAVSRCRLPPHLYLRKCLRKRERKLP